MRHCCKAGKSRSEVVENRPEAEGTSRKEDKMMRHWKTIAKVAVAVLTALLGAIGSAAAGVRI